MKISFIGSYRTVKRIFTMYALQIILVEFFILCIFYLFPKGDVGSQSFWVLMSSIFNVLLFLMLMFVQYKYDLSHNLLKNTGYIFEIDKQKIMSKELNSIKIINVNNIEKIRVYNQIMRGGLRIDVWVKNYDEFFKNSNIKIKSSEKDYVIKHKIPISIYTPVLTNYEKEKLKKVIEKIKKENGIA